MNKINKNNNKLRNIFMLGILPSLTLITVMSAVISSNSNIINNKDNNMVVKGDPVSYNLSFNPYGLLDSASSSTEKEFITSRVITYPLTFKYKKAYSDDTNKVTTQYKCLSCDKTFESDEDLLFTDKAESIPS